AVGCREAGAGRSLLGLRTSENEARDRFQWKWGKGDATAIADFADPVAGSASYNVCVYDASPSAQPLLDLPIAPGGTCAGKPCWRAVSTKGFAYKNKDGNGDGVTALKLGSGVAGKSKVQVKGAGVALASPALPLTLPVTVQLSIDSGLGTECWQSTFTNPPSKNEGEKFRAKQ
ncbi:MAG: hypothetical protein ABR587_16800, partial [Candidatus Binatia bacterium]